MTNSRHETGRTSTTTGCPVCGGPSAVVRVLERTDIQQALTKEFGSCPPDDAFDVDCYTICRCSGCTLEFASPQRAGSGAFYSWVTSQPGYYVSERWEWGETIDRIRNAPPSRRRVLEIGCGSGTFLERLKSVLDVDGVGIDTEPRAIEVCKLKGIDAHCCTVEDYLAGGHGEMFDWVVMYHCLEHVEAPLKLVQSLCQLLAPKGTLLISTPYSPMSFEGLWFDPQNHPPHHLTRWNAAAYAALAQKCELDCVLQMPRAASVALRALVSLAYFVSGPGNVTRANLLRFGVTKPLLLMREVARQLRRERYKNQPTADVVLAIMSR